MAKEHFNILLIIPLEEELLEVQKIFPEKRNRSTETMYRSEVESGEPSISMLIVQQENMGRTAALEAITDTASEFDFDLVIVLGIAGGLSRDLSLCDVCYSEGIIDVYDNTKVADNKESGTEIILSPTHYSSPRHVVAALNSIRTFTSLQTIYSNWQSEREAEAKGRFPNEVVGRKGVRETIGAPRTKNGKIACAAVSKSERYNQKIRDVERKVLAIETESGLVFSAAQRRELPALTIRGVSDYADEGKEQLEASTEDQLRAFAALNAATFLKLQFSNPEFLNAIKKYTASPTLPFDETTGSDTHRREVSTAISNFSDEVDRKLREMCPDFKLMERGYRLPVPRIRSVQYTQGVGTRFSADPVEVREALEVSDTILLNLSKNYPDNSLPWVIANDLLTAVIGGKQILPVVVDGDAVRPPRIGISQSAYYEFDDVADTDGTEIVFIIDGVPLSSKTRTNFLIDKMRERENSRFIILVREETHIAAESDFATATAAELYQLSNISFLEITHFVEKNFGLSANEAEVIALRLRDTFNSFDMSAHPSTTVAIIGKS